MQFSLSSAKKVLAPFVVVGAFALLAVLLPATALAGGSETCVSGECKYMPATFTPEAISVEKSHGSGKSTQNYSIEKIKKWKHKYEKKKHVRVNIYEKETGSSSTNCTDPTKMNWGFHAGDGFLNHGEEGLFNATWIAGWEVCDWHIVKKGGRYWVVGEKKNCGNTPIWIPIHFHIRKPRIITIEVKSYAAFYSKYIAHVHRTSESTSESEHVREVGSYSCPSGWELTGGNTCKSCPPPKCTPTCPYGSVWNGYECVKDGGTTPPPPPPAPGPNPGDEGEVGSNKCYSEETGQPVPEQPGGGCPPGSHG